MLFVNTLEFSTSEKAWAGLNKLLLLKEAQLVENGTGFVMGNQFMLYNIWVRIKKAYIDPDFNFNYYLGYTPSKWRSLVKNYLDFNYLDLLKADIQARLKKKNRAYNITLHFSNKHGGGKDCLNTITFSKRPANLHPILVFNVRTSEITKRLLFDLLLVQRIGEYVYGQDADFEIHFVAPSIFTTDHDLCIFNTYYDVKKGLSKIDKLGSFQQKVIKAYDKLMSMDFTKSTFKVTERAAKNLRKSKGIATEGNNIPVYCKDLQLHKEEIILYPLGVSSLKDQRDYQKKNKPR